MRTLTCAQVQMEQHLCHGHYRPTDSGLQPQGGFLGGIGGFFRVLVRGFLRVLVRGLVFSGCVYFSFFSPFRLLQTLLLVLPLLLQLLQLLRLMLLLLLLVGLLVLLLPTHFDSTRVELRLECCPWN